MSAALHRPQRVRDFRDTHLRCVAEAQRPAPVRRTDPTAVTVPATLDGLTVTLPSGQTVYVPRHHTPTGGRWHEMGWAVSTVLCSVGSVGVIVALLMGWLK